MDDQNAAMASHRGSIEAGSRAIATASKDEEAGCIGVHRCRPGYVQK